MVTVTKRTVGGVVRRAVALACLLLALGILITPVQWYIAHVRVRRGAAFAARRTRRVRTGRTRTGRVSEA